MRRRRRFCARCGTSERCAPMKARARGCWPSYGASAKGGGDRRRQPQMSTVSFDDVPELQLVDPNAQTDAEAGRAVLQHKVREAVAALPDMLRETVILRELQQCTYEEIATITEVPLGTVMSRLSRARTRLAGMLGGLAP